VAATQTTLSRDARGGPARILRSLAAAAVLAAGLVAGSAAGPVPQPASALEPRILLGSTGDRVEFEQALGRPLASHRYGQLGGWIPDAHMVNMKSTVSWRVVANAQPGDATYGHILRWARTLKANGHRTLFTFHHEPETTANMSYGTSADFVAAFRRVVTIFRAEGVPNVEYLWNMTANSFFTKPTDRRHALKWYPGPSYVDHVAIDPYNWYACGPGNGKWRPLAQIVEPALAFARRQGKRVVLGEFASEIDASDPARKVAWIDEAHRFLAANAPSFRAVFWFQHDGGKGCTMKVLTSGERAAFRRMADDPLFTSGNAV